MRVTARDLSLPDDYDHQLWRLVLRGLDSKTAIENDWTLDDVWDAHQALDIEEDIEVIAHQKAHRK